MCCSGRCLPYCRGGMVARTRWRARGRNEYAWVVSLQPRRTTVSINDCFRGDRAAPRGPQTARATWNVGRGCGNAAACRRGGAGVHASHGAWKCGDRGGGRRRHAAPDRTLIGAARASPPTPTTAGARPTGTGRVAASALPYPGTLPFSPEYPHVALRCRTVVRTSSPRVASCRALRVLQGSTECGLPRRESSPSH